MAKTNKKAAIIHWLQTQILHPLVLKIYHFQINRFETKIGFETEYYPIYVNEVNQTFSTKVSSQEMNLQLKLQPLAIQAGIPTPGIQNKILEDLQKVRSRYYWKNRRLQHLYASKRLSEEVYQARRTILHQALKADEAHVLSHFQASEQLEQAKLNYEAKANELQSALQASQTKWAKRRDELLARASQKHEMRLRTWQPKLDQIEAKLRTLETSMDQAEAALPEGVILRLEDLSMHFGGLKAVNQLSFDVKRGEIFGLIGPNGAGKTTVFNCITRFYKATSGKIYYRNRFGEALDLANFKVHQVIQEGIVRTFQNVELIWELNVLENLLVAAHTLYKTKFFGQLFNIKRLRKEDQIMRQKAKQILNDLNLSNYTYFYPLGLPYGILKKVELARTLMVNPDLIILDEPAAGLNDLETEGLKETIKTIQKQYNATIFLVEHDMGLVMDVCDTVCAISFGKKLAIGTPKDIQQNKTVREAYLGGE